MWKIKDPKLKAWVNQIFSDEKIDKTCSEEIDEDDSSFVQLVDLEKDIYLMLDKDAFVQEEKNDNHSIPHRASGV